MNDEDRVKFEALARFFFIIILHLAISFNKTLVHGIFRCSIQNVKLAVLRCPAQEKGWIVAVKTQRRYN